MRISSFIRPVHLDFGPILHVGHRMQIVEIFQISRLFVFPDGIQHSRRITYVKRLLFAFQVRHVAYARGIVRHALSRHVFEERIILISGARLWGLAVHASNHGRQGSNVSLYRHNCHCTRPRGNGNLSTVRMRQAITFLLNFLAFTRNLTTRLFVVLGHLIR